MQAFAAFPASRPTPPASVRKRITAVGILVEVDEVLGAASRSFLTGEEQLSHPRRRKADRTPTRKPAPTCVGTD